MPTYSCVLVLCDYYSYLRLAWKTVASDFTFTLPRRSLCRKW